MPVSPSQARKLAQERENLLITIDRAILVEYASTKSPDKVTVEIPQETYESPEMASFLEKVYQKAGWMVAFDKTSLGSSKYSYKLILAEPKKQS